MKIIETEFLEKSNTTGTDSSDLHFDQNFRHSFLNEKVTLIVGSANKCRVEGN